MYRMNYVLTSYSTDSDMLLFHSLVSRLRLKPLNVILFLVYLILLHVTRSPELVKALNW